MPSNAETALLGLLSETPMYPYQIEKEVVDRDMRYWTELSMSSIYKLLRKMETLGWVRSNSEISEENRLRKLYEITPAGTKQLKKRIKDLLSEPEHIRWQFDLGIYNCDLISPLEIRDALLRYRAKLEENISGYKDLEKFLIASGCPVHRLAVSTRPRYLFRAEIEWIDNYLKNLPKSL
jgi:DNA-binding PadR family transcriptional regulator